MGAAAGRATTTKAPAAKAPAARTPTATKAPATTKPPAASSRPTATTTSTSGCDPNYTGACVPIASDVDCAGGSGNGPAYVEGPVTVVGADIYRLDADQDGIGCE